MRLGPWEIVLIALAVVVLFGAKKIPDIMRGLGQGVREFKSAMRDDGRETPQSKSKQDEGKGDNKT